MIIASSRSIYGEGKYFCNHDGHVYPFDRQEEDLLQGNFEPRCPFCKGKLELNPTDEISKIHPSSIYGITKHQQEQMILLMGKVLNIPAIALRYQNVYGPGQYSSLSWCSYRNWYFTNFIIW